MGPDGLFPSLSLFDTFPSFTALNMDSQAQSAHMHSVTLARNEMAHILFFYYLHISIFTKCAITFSVAEEAGYTANVLGIRFFLTIKETETDNPVSIAQFVFQGHTYVEKIF